MISVSLTNTFKIKYFHLILQIAPGFQNHQVEVFKRPFTFLHHFNSINIMKS